jgi:hypothetical protein
MKFAILGLSTYVLTVSDETPSLSNSQDYSVVEISDEQAKIIQDGREAQPKVFYCYQNGEFITLQQHAEAQRQARVLEQTAQMQTVREATQKARLDAMPLSKKIEMGESHVERQGFGASRLVTCMDLLLQAKEAGTIADKPKLVAVYQWLQQVKGTALAGSITFAPAPFSFEQVLSEV